MKHLVLTLALLPTLAHAAITLTLTDEQETDNAQIYVYSNANYTEHCKYTKTFKDD